MHNPSANPEGSKVGNLGRRVLAWVVLIVAAAIVIKIAFGAVIGILTFLLTVAAVIVAIGAIFWALRRL
jgi:hypothetical protein